VRFRENSKLVDRLADTLRAFDIEVWLDRERLRPGSRWKDAIRDAINSGAFFIACFSVEYYQRMKTFMNEELTLAIEELRLRPTDQSWFIPVLLNDCRLPERNIGAGETLGSIQHVALYADWTDGVQRILSVIQPVSGVVYQLMQKLTDQSSRSRIKAADNLGEMGRAAERAVPALLELLSDDNETVRAAAADALGNIGIPDRQVVLKLLAITGDDGHPHYPVVHANNALAKMGAAAVPVLIEALAVPDDRIRTASYTTLARLGDVALSALTKALDSDDPAVRDGAIRAIGIMKRPAHAPIESPLPGLLRLLAQGSASLTDNDLKTRYESAAAATALGELRDPAAVPVLIDALSNPNHLCVSAALALGKIAHPSAVEPLIGVLRDANKFWVPRGAAAVALGDMG
jgi:HEAT repeat protein